MLSCVQQGRQSPLQVHRLLVRCERLQHYSVLNYNGGEYSKKPSVTVQGDF